MWSRTLSSVYTSLNVRAWPYALVGLLTATGHFSVLSHHCLGIGPENQQVAEEQFIDGLIARRLFPLAVLACEDRLAVRTMSPLERVNTVVDLSRTYAAWAIQSPPKKQLQYWDQANAVLENWLGKNSQDVLQLIISRQVAHVALMRGKFSRQISAGTVDPEPARKESLQYLRQCKDVAEKTLQKINKALIDSQDQELSAFALLRLQSAVEKDLSQAWLEQALCFDPGSPDRIHSLQQAEKLILPLAAKRDPIDWESRVAQLTCLRLSEGKNNEQLFQEKTAAFLVENPPVDVQGQIHVELARQLATKNRYIEAIGELNQPINYSPEMEAKVDFCELQIMLQAAGNTKATDTANWNQRAENQLELIETLHDPYWLQRARALFGRLITIDQSQHGYSLLARAAEGLYQAGQLTEAAKVYEDAANKADAEKDYTKAFELYRAAAMISYEKKNYSEASQKFRQLADTYSQAPGAAAAHLMAAFNLARSLEGTSAGEFTAYKKLLEEHLSRWPQQASSNQARLWLGRVLAADGKWSAANQTLFKVDPKSASYPEAMAVAGKCCIKECRTLKKNGDSQLSQRATALSEKLKMAASILIDANSPLAPAMVADTVMLQMQYTSSPYRSALGLIQRGLKSITKNDSENRWRLEALQVEALVGLGRYREALDTVRTFSGSKELTVQLILSLDDLENRQAKTVDRTRLHSIAEIQMACIKKIGDISVLASRKELAVIQAKTLERLGKISDALTGLRKLSSEYSEDGQIQMRFADLLIQQGESGNLREALRKYREVARKTRPQTERWFAAKYGEARARLRLGDAKKAAQMIRTTQVLYPDLGGKPWRRRFEELLATCIQQEAFPDQ